MAYSIEGYIVFSWIGGCVLFFINLISGLLIHPPKFEMDLLRRLNISCKPLVFFLVLLQLPLLYIAANFGTPIVDAITSYSNGDSWNYGWGRPLLALGFLGVGGLFLTSHWFFRFFAFFGLVQDLILSTLSAFDLDRWIDCINKDKCVATTGYNSEWYLALRTRDCGAMFLEVWLLLLVISMSLTIGCFSSRYSYRELSTGDANRMAVMRKELRRFKFQKAKSNHSQKEPKSKERSKAKATKTEKSLSERKYSEKEIDLESKSSKPDLPIKKRKQKKETMQMTGFKETRKESNSSRKKSAKISPTVDEDAENKFEV